MCKAKEKIKEKKEMIMDFEEELYRRMCRACPNQRMCHDDCEYCDEYLEELEKHDTEISNL